MVKAILTDFTPNPVIKIMWSSTIFHRKIDSDIINFEYKMKKKHGDNFSRIKREFMRM